MKKIILLFSMIITLFIPMGVSASSIVETLPKVPADVQNYVIAYMPDIKTYRLGSYAKSGTFSVSDDGSELLIDGQRELSLARYELKDGEWVQYTTNTYWSTWFDDPNSHAKIPLYSSNDLYYKGEMYLSGTTENASKHNFTMVGNQLSSSAINSIILNQMKGLLVIIIPLLIAFFALFRGWGFIKNAVK